MRPTIRFVAISRDATGSVTLCSANNNRNRIVPWSSITIAMRERGLARVYASSSHFRSEVDVNVFPWHERFHSGRSAFEKSTKNLFLQAYTYNKSYTLYGNMYNETAD